MLTLGLALHFFCTNTFAQSNFKNLVWQDEFNYQGLPDSTKWSYDKGTGCPENCGWGNNELQYYTSNRLENSRVEDGKLTIETRKENFSGASYTSARLATKNKGDWQYGRLDIKAKLPAGRGLWPAVWMLPTNWAYGGWPHSGEIDIMEMIGKEPSKNYGTLHFGPGPGSTQLGKNIGLPTGIFNDAFHVFSLEWSENEIKWFLDGKLFSSFSKNDFGKINYPFNEDFFLIINLAVGGNWPGNPDINMYKNQFLVVDYVRVFEKKK